MISLIVILAFCLQCYSNGLEKMAEMMLPVMATKCSIDNICGQPFDEIEDDSSFHAWL